jgi:hypothetical protein
MRLAWSFAMFRDGNRMAIRIAMIAITTSSSISVKALVLIFIVPFFQQTTSTRAPGEEQSSEFLRFACSNKSKMRRIHHLFRLCPLAGRFELFSNRVQDLFY